VGASPEKQKRGHHSREKGILQKTCIPYSKNRGKTYYRKRHGKNGVAKVLAMDISENVLPWQTKMLHTFWTLITPTRAVWGPLGRTNRSARGEGGSIKRFCSAGCTPQHERSNPHRPMPCHPTTRPSNGPPHHHTSVQVKTKIEKVHQKSPILRRLI
jgi:hypothetical protein